MIVWWRCGDGRSAGHNSVTALVHYVALARLPAQIENKNITLSNLSGVPLKASYRKLTWLAARDGGGAARPAHAPSCGGPPPICMCARSPSVKRHACEKAINNYSGRLICESLVFIINAGQLRQHARWLDSTPRPPRRPPAPPQRHGKPAENYSAGWARWQTQIRRDATGFLNQGEETPLRRLSDVPKTSLNQKSTLIWIMASSFYFRNF